MAGYLICVSCESGVPIFARRIGDVNAIPFPLAASMNGVAMFGKANKLELISTLTESGRVFWKDYEKSLTLIFVGSNDAMSDLHHENLVDNIYHAIVFYLGIDDVRNIKNLDKLKKDCRRVYPVIDKYLYGLNPHDHTLYFGDITLCADVSLHSETQSQFQDLLDSLLNNMNCNYGAIIVNGVIMAASKDWWCLKGPEICLITFVANQPATEQFFDVPVYLPLTSPELPFRLIVSRAKKSNIQLVILCGKEPEVNFIQSEIKKWKSSAKDVFSQFSRDPRPPSFNCRLINSDPALLGYLIVNQDKQRCSFALAAESRSQTIEATAQAYRLNILRTFYRSTVGCVFPITSSVKDENGHRALETYWTSEFHKCHAVQSLTYQLFALYKSSITLTAMRSASQRVLHELMKDKILKS